MDTPPRGRKRAGRGKGTGPARDQTRGSVASDVADLVAHVGNRLVDTAQRFLAIHPGNKDAPYAYYLIGLSYYEQISDVTSIAKAMKHVRDLVGIDYVALGSDYDGGTTVRFDTSKLVQVTQALIDAGFTDDEIRAAMGGNAIRVLKAGIVPLPRTPLPLAEAL